MSTPPPPPLPNNSLLCLLSPCKVISLLTIGYGDIVVQTGKIDRTVDSLVILWGLGTLCIWAAYASRALSSIRAHHRQGEAGEVNPFRPRGLHSRVGGNITWRHALRACSWAVQCYRSVVEGFCRGGCNGTEICGMICDTILYAHDKKV